MPHSFAPISIPDRRAAVRPALLAAGLALTLTLGGCATGYTAVESGSRMLDGALSVPVDGPWVNVDFVGLSGKNGERDALWTLDGVDLNTVSFFVKTADGEPLLTSPDETVVFPAFRSDMTELELQELLVDTIAQAHGGVRPEVLAFVPRDFADSPGFELELAFTDQNDLQRRAFIAGAMKEGSLTAIAYEAPRIHYYGKDLGRVRALVDGARFVSDAT